MAYVTKPERLREKLAAFPFTILAYVPNDDGMEAEQIIDHGDHGHTFGDWTYTMVYDGSDIILRPRFRLFFQNERDMAFARLLFGDE